MSKNIIIFSDGTGQAGGLLPDEVRTNVYKLFRATRCGPDSAIDPSKQLTFYDPGLGSQSDGGSIKFGLLRKIRNLVSQGTGLGITDNLIDCYSAIVRLWQPDDRIFLFGFSRGAYTVRCLAGVLALCGVPRTKDGAALKLDPASLTAVATEAVKKVYQYGGSIEGNPFNEERQQVAREFRARYGCAAGDKPNAIPYFIGVWDTVAAMGMKPPIQVVIGAALLCIFSSLVAWLLCWCFGSYWVWFFCCAAVTMVMSAIIYLATHLYYHPLKKRFYLAAWRMTFNDTELNPDVPYAKHAMSIDEDRADFIRVPWSNAGFTYPDIKEGEEIRFEQIWFAGNHADIGGGYAENESRLSDVTLEWMVRAASNVPNGVDVDRTVLRPYPAADGPQHDECKSGIGGKRWIPWLRGNRPVPAHAPLHASVLERFTLAAVLNYDTREPYRPEPLRDHELVRHYYTDTKPSD